MMCRCNVNQIVNVENINILWQVKLAASSHDYRHLFLIF